MLSLVNLSASLCHMSSLHIIVVKATSIKGGRNHSYWQMISKSKIQFINRLQSYRSNEMCNSAGLQSNKQHDSLALIFSSFGSNKSNMPSVTFTDPRITSCLNHFKKQKSKTARAKLQTVIQ